MQTLTERIAGTVTSALFGRVDDEDRKVEAANEFGTFINGLIGERNHWKREAERHERISAARQSYIDALKEELTQKTRDLDEERACHSRAAGQLGALLGLVNGVNGNMTQAGNVIDMQSRVDRLALTDNVVNLDTESAA